MPSIDKQGGGLTITFAPKNEDVRKILVGYKEKKIKLTDYVCDAIRFFEANKDKINSSTVNQENIAEMIKLEVERQLKDIKITLPETNEEAITLEDDLDAIDDSDTFDD